MCSSGLPVTVTESAQVFGGGTATIGVNSAMIPTSTLQNAGVNSGSTEHLNPPKVQSGALNAGERSIFWASTCDPARLMAVTCRRLLEVSQSGTG